MSQTRLAKAERQVIDRVLRGAEFNRRDLFYVSLLGATSAAAATTTHGWISPASAQAQDAPVAKDIAQIMGIGGANYTGRWFDYTTFITPIEQFYIRNHYPTPRPEEHPELVAENWSVQIHGESVLNPMTLTYEDLLGMRTHTIFATMECHGNARTIFWEQQGMEDVTGGNWGLGAIGQAEWKIIPMSEIFDRVGLRHDAREVLFWSGVDGGDMGRPMPVDQILARPDDIGLAIQMNGVDLPLDHGYPVRVVVPGWGGTASIKWLREIKIAPYRFWCRLNTRGEVYIGPDHYVDTPGPNDEFRDVTEEDIQGNMVTWMNVKSTLTLPLVLRESQPPVNYPLEQEEIPHLPEGTRTMIGFAWAPHGVRKVEYRINGSGWQEAELRPPFLGKYCWVRFEFPWEAPSGLHTIETRATDNLGSTQPETYPFNRLGMTNNAIPKFEIEVD